VFSMGYEEKAQTCARGGPLEPGLRGTCDGDHRVSGLGNGYYRARSRDVKLSNGATSRDFRADGDPDRVGAGTTVGMRAFKLPADRMRDARDAIALRWHEDGRRRRDESRCSAERLLLQFLECAGIDARAKIAGAGFAYSVTYSRCECDFASSPRRARPIH